MDSLGLFGTPSSRGCFLIFTSGPKETEKKVPYEQLKMTIFLLYVKRPSRSLKFFFFTPEPAKPTSLTLQLYSLGVVEKPPSRRFILTLTPGPKESNKKVLHVTLKIKMLGSSVKRPRSLILIFTLEPAKPTSLTLQMYSMNLFGKPPSRGLILFFTLGPKSNKNVLHAPLKMTILSPCVETP